MHNDLRKVARPTRKKPGMQEFFILILVYSYYNRNSHNSKNEFSVPQSVLADYFNCSVVTIKRWCEKLRDLGYLQYAERDNAGKTVYYKDHDTKKSYTIPKYKRIRVGEDPKEIKFLNVYTLDQKKLNQYLIDTIDLDILNNIEANKSVFNDFIAFLSKRQKYNDFIASIDTENLPSVKEIQNNLSNDTKKARKTLNIIRKLGENAVYIAKKKVLDQAYPDFQCKYLEEGCLRLTHEICSTVNPEHIDKINEENYWRSSNVRNNMLTAILHSDKFVEYDINGSIYRLTYNLYHDDILGFKEDIYELIWNNCRFNKDWPKNEKEQYRNAFKVLLMPIYMKEYTLGYRANQWEYIKKYYADHPRKYNRLSNQEKEFYETYKLFVDLIGWNLKDILKEIARALHETLNTQKFMKSDIFTHESNLHILIREKLMMMGVKSVNVYDGFYIKKNSISLKRFYEVYNESLIELKTNLQNGIGSPIY